MKYEPYFTQEFEDKLTKFRHLKKQIGKKIEHLMLDPYRNARSELLIDNLKGLRSARLTTSIRVIFAICEECRSRGWQDLVGCPISLCSEGSEGEVVMLTLDVHEKAYRRR